MSEPMFAADLHLGQKNVSRFRTQFFSVEDHDQTVVDNILHTINKRTTLYLLGDIAFTKESLDYLKLIRHYCNRLILIPGNHCTEKISMETLVRYYDEIHASLSAYGFWLTHQPIHGEHLRGRLCVHGHLHDQFVNDSRYVCVSLEHTLYHPISLTQIREIFDNRIDSGDLPESYRPKLKLKTEEQGDVK